MLTEVPSTAVCTGGEFPALDCSLFCPCSPAWSSCHQTDEWWLDQSRECVLSPRSLSLPPSTVDLQQYWLQGRSLALGRVCFGDRHWCWLTPCGFLLPRQQVPSCTLELWGE